MILRIAREYSLDPGIVASWPLRRYKVVRNELFQSWQEERDAARRAMAKARGEDEVTVVDFDKKMGLDRKAKGRRK